MGKTYSRDRQKPEVYRDLKRKAPKKKLRGFTLIELLIVLSVALTLVFIIGRAFNCSKAPQCKYNEKVQLQNGPAKNYLNN